MSGPLAILACGGSLPVQLVKAYPNALRFSLKGIPHDLGDITQEHQIEKLGGLFAAMKDAGVHRVVFAGGLARPALNPAELDPVTMALVPRIMTAMQGGDDGLLRQVIAIFEEQGFSVIGAHELLPDLTATSDLQVGTPSGADLTDATRAWDILSALSPLDVGQGCVVAGGQCLGIETIQGTDALLGFVSGTPDTLKNGAKGVFVKAAKRGQDLRVDMPAIGPRTIQAVADAGLAGLVIETGRVMILERTATLDAVKKSGLFLTARTL